MNSTREPFALIEPWEIDSPYMEKHTATGRARCRVCGEKIAKAETEWRFAHSFSDAQYNSWTAVECHAHEACLPDERER